MNIPLTVQSLLNQSLNEVRNEPQHHLAPRTRLSIYNAFGPSNYPSTFELVEMQIKNERFDLTKADYSICWLAITTARKVLPVWEQSFSILEKEDSDSWDNFPSEMLAVAEEALVTNTNLLKDFQNVMYDEFYLLIGNIHYDTNEKALWACYAAYYALRLIFLGIPGMDYTAKCVEFNDEYNIPVRCQDFARMSVNSYCVIDNNAMKSRRYLESIGKYIPLKFDIQKRLEFWEWWLTEAIPQAWELAQQNNASH